MMMSNIFLQKELQSSYNSPNSYGILSRLVCQHQSEHPEFSSSQIQQSLNRTEKVFNATYTFWKELKSKGIFHTDTFWYFEPFAWVTQMMKIFRIRNGFDIDKAVLYLNKNAEPTPIKKCAKYVRLAMEAGGMDTLGRPNSACNYDKFLPKKGFTEVEITSLEDYMPQKGDIAVFEAFMGKSRYHKHGHIQMYNGKQWVSDFKQRDFWAGSDYRIYKPKFKIFRW